MTTGALIVRGLPTEQAQTPPSSTSMSLVSRGNAFEATFQATVEAALNFVLTEIDMPVYATVYVHENDGGMVTRIFGAIESADALGFAVGGERVEYDELAAIHLHD